MKTFSKVKPEEIALRRAEWYQRAGVEGVRGVEESGGWMSGAWGVGLG